MNDSVVVADPENEAKTEEPRPSRRYLLPALIAGVVIASVLALTFFFLWLVEADKTPDELQGDVTAFLEDESTKVEDVTRDLVGILTTYDETNASQLRDRMSEVATGSFLENFEQLFSAGLSEAIEGASVSSRGRIVTGPVVGFKNGSQAFAVTEVTQTYQNRRYPGGLTVNYVIEIDFVKTATEGWRADRVDLLSIEAG
ncbi:MAG: hypothetical protein M3280_02565 [Actinomycetota bacterium]|nr:hypothetical protein [Actinomycetota bacterium]